MTIISIAPISSARLLCTLPIQARGVIFLMSVVDAVELRRETVFVPPGTALPCSTVPSPVFVMGVIQVNIYQVLDTTFLTPINAPSFDEIFSWEPALETVMSVDRVLRRMRLSKKPH